MIRRLICNRSASSAAEFAIVLPLMLTFLFGIIDAGRWMWTYNEAEKATQMGARLAVVTDPVSSALGGSYVGACTPALTQGDLIPASCFTTVTCISTGCTSGTKDDAAFTRIVDRMRLYLPGLSEENVVVQYSGSGLGFAGNPNGPDVSPLVTVKIGDTGAGATALQFVPITTYLLVRMNMPTFTTTLTGEDSVGGKSN